MYEKTAVGDKYVSEAMVQNGSRLGGEQSGHIIFKKYANTGDGVLTAIKIMEVILETKHTLSELKKPMYFYPQSLKSIHVTDQQAAMNDPVVQVAIKEAEDRIGENGRVLVRKSGTEPVIRVMAEAEDQAVCDKAVREIIGVIEAKGYAAG